MMAANSTELREKLEKAFAENMDSGAELGAAVCVWGADGEWASFGGGWKSKAKDDPWRADTLVPVYSATKGPAAACVLHALATHGLDPDTSVARLWPKLAAHLSVGELLSHQGGLAALDRKAPVGDHAAVIEALEAQEPAWSPPDHGYHPRTFGWLADELVRRITGAESLGQYWKEVIADPFGLDFHIGLVKEHHHRVATLYPGKAAVDPSEETFYAAFNQPNSPTRRAFLSPHGMHSVAEMNQAPAWEAGWPGFGGVGSAVGLAKFYGLLANGQILPEEALAWARVRLSNGRDRVLLMPTAFSAGFMMDPLSPGGEKLRSIFGPGLDAFGHPGAGGSHAFADPRRRFGFAYVMNQMSLAVLPHIRAMRLVAALD